MEDPVMTKRNVYLGIGLIALVAAWYAFRPELLFINRTVDEKLPVAQATSMAMSKETGPMVLAKGDFRSLAHETKERPRFTSSLTASAYFVSPTSKLPMVPMFTSTSSPPRLPRT